MQLIGDAIMTRATVHVQGYRQSGFTLLEVLIALLILSIGLLGLAALQTTGLRSNQMASMRTQATQAAYDITDRMRANPTGVEADEYIISRTEAPSDTGVTGMALADLTDWRNNVERLPGGKSEITQQTAACDSTTSPPCNPPTNIITHVVTVYWDEARTGVNGTNCPPLSKDDLRCFRLSYTE
jgi:type IV pilus assembly protein PilV